MISIRRHACTAAFQEYRRHGCGSYSEVVTRLVDLVKKWLDACDTIERVR